MRIAVLILACCLTLDAFGQFRRKKDLFQVILADKVARSGGKSIKSMDFLQTGDTVVVSSGGTLAMLHKKMYPVEISVDSVIVINELSTAIETYVNLNVYGMKYAKDFNVSRLFALKPGDVKPDRMYWGAVHRGVFEFELFYPPMSWGNNRLDMSDDLCITWRPIKGLAKIEILDLYENVILSFPVLTNSFTIPKEEFMKIKEKNALLGTGDSVGVHRTYTILSKFNNTLPFPFPCNLDKPSSSLLVALVMEFANPPYLEGAEKYYVLATTLSPHPFYTQMLNNYRERRKSNWNR